MNEGSLFGKWYCNDFSTTDSASKHFLFISILFAALLSKTLAMSVLRWAFKTFHKWGQTTVWCSLPYSRRSAMLDCSPWTCHLGSRLSALAISFASPWRIFFSHNLLFYFSIYHSATEMASSPHLPGSPQSEIFAPLYFQMCCCPYFILNFSWNYLS